LQAAVDLITAAGSRVGKGRRLQNIYAVRLLAVDGGMSSVRSHILIVAFKDAWWKDAGPRAHVVVTRVQACVQVRWLAPRVLLLLLLLLL
jgi:hypothetical protein